MELIKALKFTQWAVARKSFVESLVHFQIKNKTIQSYNGTVSLCSPIDLDLDCLPKAGPFIKAIQTCKDTVQLSITPAGRLSIKSGGFRALIDCAHVEFPEIAPEGREIAPEGGIMAALKILEPLISEDASRPWSRGILISGAHAYATNNVVLAEYSLGFEFPVTLNLPHAAVNELMRIGEEPSRIMVTDASASFLYEDGRWLRTQLLSVEWPDMGKVLDREHQAADIPEGFWQGLTDIAPFTDAARSVYLKPNYLTTSLDSEVATYANVPGIPDGGCYDIEMLKMLQGLTTRLDFTSYPQPCLWFGDKLRGAVIGRRT